MHGDALAGRVVADSGLRALTRNDQIAVLEYLEGGHRGRGVDNPPDDTTAEEEFVRRLGPRPPSEHRHDPHDLNPEYRQALEEAKRIEAQPNPSILDAFNASAALSESKQLARFDPAATHIDRAVCTHYTFHTLRLLAWLAELAAGSLIAFAALSGLVAGVDWVVEGFQ
jgi:hypothetical protein